METSWKPGLRTSFQLVCLCGLRPLQCLLDIIDKAVVDIDMSFNTKKTVCMIFNPHVKHKLISGIFPQFHLAGCKLSFVPNFKYLGHIIDNRLQDDDDVYTEN